VLHRSVAHQEAGPSKATANQQGVALRAESGG